MVNMRPNDLAQRHRVVICSPGTLLSISMEELMAPPDNIIIVCILFDLAWFESEIQTVKYFHRYKLCTINARYRLYADLEALLF